MGSNRRQFLQAIAAPLAAGFGMAGRALAADEPFPVFASDVQQVEYRFRRHEIDYQSDKAPGTIIVDTGKRFLYLVLGHGRAIRYGVGVGHQGADWSGTAVIKRKAKWPRWSPTPEQLARSKIVARWVGGMPGGMGNPLGARALYLYKGNVDTYYRIHGTDDPTSIGHYVSSGCIRLINMDIIDLYDRVEIGTRVVVLDRKSGGGDAIFGGN